MAPLRGWGPRRKRLIAHVPHGHWKTMTFLAALRRDRIDAPWVLDGPINGEAFKTYVRNELLKTLKPGDIVVLDNLGSHKGKAVRNMIRNAGAHLMFLPPYSPDLNPIEQPGRICGNLKATRSKNVAKIIVGARSLSRRTVKMRAVARREESSTLSVSRPMLDVVLKDWVIDTNETPC